MGLVDLRQSSGDRSGPEVTRPSPTPSIPLRKKSTFNIAFLTGRSEEEEPRQAEEESEERSIRGQSEESYSGRSSPSGGSSDSSIIDILSEPTTVVVPSVNQNRKRKSSDREPRHVDKVVKGDQLIPKLLTSSFNFLPQFKGPLNPAMVHFGSTTFPPPQPSSSSPLSPPKIRRGFYGHGHSSSSSAECPPAQFYPPYHPFLIGPPPPPPEPTNHSPPNSNPPTLLPPSLAALSLPAQNVCAKCKIGFRMTSDLVYHMRSHHKRETDPQQKKREEKLKCPVCHETFRERHHLTRHMTAHQDREEEAECQAGKV